MKNNEIKFCTFMSWEQSMNHLFKLQRRLYKSIYVLDKTKALTFQKLILLSSSIRLIAIREVTQLDSRRKIPGADGKVCLNFMERFELSENLKFNLTNWVPGIFRNILIVRKNGIAYSLNIPNISDRCWECLVKYSLQPAHEAIFSFRNCGFRPYFPVHKVQRLFFYNLNKDSFGSQKRLLLVNLSAATNTFNLNYLLNKLIIPRGVKLGIFRCFSKGLSLGYSSENIRFSELGMFLLNVLLDGVENLHPCIRFGYEIFYFLKPFDSEVFVIEYVKDYVSFLGFKFNCTMVNLISFETGFNFLNWNFKLLVNGNLLCVPSFDSYQSFLRRVKYIINNSNYGADIKALKLIPNIQDWQLLHKYCSKDSFRYSLFFIKRRIFKIFKKEVKQDIYSTKKFLNRIFLQNLANSKIRFVEKSFPPYIAHKSFWVDFVFFNFTLNSRIKRNYFCIHCGLLSEIP